MSEKCFCHFNDYAVKDATARKITDNFVTPEMFGAKADGVTDDSSAITQALNQGKPVLMRGVYAVSSTMQGNATMVCGLGCKIVLLNDMNYVFKLPNAKKVSGISFDCNSKGVTCCIDCKDVESVEIRDIDISNVYDTRTNSGSILVRIDNVPVVTISEMRFENCNHIGNGTIADSNGNISCIFVTGYEKQCTITNITGNEIHNVDGNGNYIFEDSNVVYVATSNENSETSIRNVYGYNFGKRLIKTQCGGTVTIDGVTSYSNSIECISAIGVLHDSGPIGKTIISNCALVNDYESETKKQFLITVDSDALITNCILKSKTQYSIFNESVATIIGCVFDGMGVITQGDSTITRIDSCKATGTHLFTENLSTNSLFEVNNCTAKLTTALCAVANAKIIVRNSNIECKYTTIKTDAIIENNNINGSIAILSGNVICRNLYMFTEKENMNAIEVKTGANATVENLFATGFRYDFVLRDTTAYIKGVNLEKVHSLDATTTDNYPGYVSKLTGLTLGNGAQVILLTDNKLYKKENGVWTAVGTEVTT